MEDADPSWARKAIAELPEADRVSVVPFYFGGVSAQRRFHMQGGMENHCLFQARHRAQWLFHVDVDEYFENRARGGLGLADYVHGLPAGTGAVTVRSQFWAVTAGARHDDPFPCYITCKQPGYFPADHRSK